MKISEEDFYKICGKDTDVVLAELQGKGIGTYVCGYKSIWSIDRDSLESALSYYKNYEKKNANTLWKWIISVIISTIDAFIGILLKIN